MRARRRLNELSPYPDAPTRFSYASFEHVADAEFAPNLLDVDRLTLVGEARISRDDEQGFETRQGGNNVFHDAIGEVFLFRISAHVLKRQYCDRRLVGKRKRVGGVTRRFRARSRSRSRSIEPHRPVDVFERPLAEVIKGER